MTNSLIFEPRSGINDLDRPHFRPEDVWELRAGSEEPDGLSRYWRIYCG